MSERYDYSDAAETPGVAGLKAAAARAKALPRIQPEGEIRGRVPFPPAHRIVYGIALMVFLATLAVLSVVLSGCANAKADFHAASSAVVGLLTVAADNPELLDEAKAGLSDLAGKALSPTDQAVINQALTHATAGNAKLAAADLTPLVTASAPSSTATPKANDPPDDTEEFTRWHRPMQGWSFWK